MISCSLLNPLSLSTTTYVINTKVWTHSVEKRRICSHLKKIFRENSFSGQTFRKLYYQRNEIFCKRQSLSGFHQSYLFSNWFPLFKKISSSSHVAASNIFFSQHSLSVFLEFNSRLYTKCRQAFSFNLFFAVDVWTISGNPELTFWGAEICQKKNQNAKALNLQKRAFLKTFE